MKEERNDAIGELIASLEQTSNESAVDILLSFINDRMLESQREHIVKQLNESRCKDMDWARLAHPDDEEEDDD